MPKTLFPAGIASGNATVDGSYQGAVLLVQRATLNQNSTSAVSATFKVPRPDGMTARLIDIIFDVETAFNSVTSATGTVGKTAGGTEYAGSVDVKTAAGRIRPTFTGAQLTAMGAPDADDVVATITPSGATSAGKVSVTLVYAVF